MILINDKNCSDLKIVFSELPSIPKPVRNVEEKFVSGRDGSLIIDRGTYQNIPIMLIGHAECKRTELIDYFGTTGELKFETSPDRFWKYRVTAIDVKEVLDDGVLLAFSINMSLGPHKYLVSGKSKIIGSSTLSLKNDYNANAYPFLKIKGTGTIGIIKNGIQILSIKDITDYVDIDCEADVIHRNNVNYDNKAIGDTFYLDANKTTELKFTGNVSEVILIPNWREI
nr:MAG TPA: distal tail protein [Caudoviricetes sp.]